MPWAAAGVSGILLGVSLLPLLAEPTLPVTSYVRLSTFVSVLSGYTIASTWIAIRGAVRDPDRLQPLLQRSSGEYASLVRSITHHHTRHLVIASGAGIAVSIVLVGGLYGYSDSLEWTPLGLWLPTVAAFAWAISCCALFILVSISLLFRRVGATLPEINLFDPAALAPFTRVGTRLALILLGMMALRLLLISPQLIGVGVVASISGLVLVIALASLVLPLWGVHRRIGTEKQRELARVQEAINREQAAAESRSPGGSRELLDLLEYKSRVVAVREWPLDTPQLVRFALYLAVPLLGWIGGALVERLFDRLLQG